MADTKLSALTELATPAGEDLVYLVDDPAGTPLSRRATLTNVFANVTATNATNATNVTMGAAPSDTAMYPMLVGAATDTNQAPKYDTSLVWDATNNELELDGDIVGTKTGGITITGGDSDGEFLTLRGNSADLDDQIKASSPFEFRDGTVTWASAPSVSRLGGFWDGTLEIDYASWGAPGAEPSMFTAAGTLEMSVGPILGGGLALFRNESTIQNDGTAINATGFGAGVIYGLADVPTMNQTGAGNYRWANLTSVYSAPTISRGGSGTMTIDLQTAASSSVTVNANTTVTTRKAFNIEDGLGSGTLTNQVGLTSVLLTKGTTSNIGLLLGTSAAETPPPGQWSMYVQGDRPARFQAPVAFGVNSDLGNATYDETGGAVEDMWTLTSHGLRVGDRVRFRVAGGGATGYAANTDYYVVSAPNANRFTLSATLGGSAIEGTGDSTGTWTLRRSTTPASNGNAHMWFWRNASSNEYLIIEFNDGGTTRYRHMRLDDATTVAFTHATSLP